MDAQPLLGLQNDDKSSSSSSSFKTGFNGIATLIGISILSFPYAIFSCGWMGLMLNLLVALCFARATWFMVMCQKKDNELENYQDMAYKVLPRQGRALFLILFYLDAIGALIAYSTSIADNLSYIYQDQDVSLFHMEARTLFILLSFLVILPTTWVQSLSNISFLSCAYILCLMITVVCLLWIGTTDVGFHHTMPLFKPGGIPEATGIFSFSYGSTFVFPTVYTSMEDKSHFPMVLLSSFSVSIVCSWTIGILGVLMFGKGINQQVTLSMPRHLIASKIAIWATAATPVMRFALVLAPVAIDIEGWVLKYLKLNKESRAALAMSIFLRSLLLAIIVFAAAVMANFAATIELVGSSMTILLCVTLPCIFYVHFYKQELTKLQVTEVCVLIIISIALGISGTYASVKNLLGW